MYARWYVMEEDGPYNWQRATGEHGPYYAREQLFNDQGYPSEVEAEEAIKNAFDSGHVVTYPLFIVKGFDR